MKITAIATKTIPMDDGLCINRLFLYSQFRKATPTRSDMATYLKKIRRLITSWQPLITSSTFFEFKVPIFSSSLFLSTVAIWLTTTTLPFGRFAMPFFKRTFPGTLASFKFEVSNATTVVRMLLLLSKSFWTITAGRFPDGPEFPEGPNLTQ